MSRLGVLYGGSAPHHRSLFEPRYGSSFDDVLYLPDVAADPRVLEPLDGLVIPERLHRRPLDQLQPHLLALLERGGTLVVFGEQSIYRDQPRGWLPGIEWEPRPTNYWWWLEPGGTSGIEAVDPDHPIFAGRSPTDATWHHHGILRPPPDAEVILSGPDGGAVLYVDRHSTPGCLVVATVDPLYHHGSYFMPAAGVFLDGFLPWLASWIPERSGR